MLFHIIVAVENFTHSLALFLFGFIKNLEKLYCLMIPVEAFKEDFSLKKDFNIQQNWKKVALNYLWETIWQMIFVYRKDHGSKDIKTVK